jgi:hypothetical protein
MQNNLVPVIIVAILVIGGVFAIAQYFRRKGMQWSGIVIDKGYTESTNISNRNFQNGPTTIILGAQRPNLKYYIVVKTNEGKELRWNVSEGLYQTFNIGDALQKNSGTLIPEVVTTKSSI